MGAGGGFHANEIACRSVTSLWMCIGTQKVLSGGCLCDGTTGQGVGLGMALNSFMSKSTDLSAWEASAYSPSSAPYLRGGR